MKILKGDTVQVIKGKDKGKTGVVQQVYPNKNLVLVEGINKVKKHVKAKGKEEGGILDLTKPLSVSNVMLLCPKTNKPTKIGYKIVDGKKVRVAKVSGEVLGTKKDA